MRAEGTADIATQDPAPPAPGTFPAAWYPDPLGRWAHRYWDGGAWTDWVSDGTHQFCEPVDVPAASYAGPDPQWRFTPGVSGWAIAAGFASPFAFFIAPAPIALTL